MKQLSRITSFALVAGMLLGITAALMPARPAAAAEACTRMEFSRRQNSSHWCVEYIQTMLNLVNRSGLAPDGEYGSRTSTAIKAWQAKLRKSDVGMMVDGIVGPQTWDRLCLQKAKYPSDFASKVGCDVRRPVAAPRSCDDLTISPTRENDKTDCISYLRQMLNFAVKAELMTKGKYTSDVERAVKEAQLEIRKTNAKVYATGITGPRTWQGLCNWQNVPEIHKTAYTGLKKKIGC